MLSNKEAIKNTVKNHEPGIFNKSISWVKQLWKIENQTQMNNLTFTW